MQIQQIPSLRLGSHQLLKSEMLTPKMLVSKMGAVQAQDFAMSKWALGIRLPGCTNASVDEAFNRGEILRTHVLRPTWHFVAPENIRWMLELSADRIKSAARSRDRDLEITEILYGQTNRLMRKALEGGKELTREALGKFLEKAKIRLNTARMTHFLMRAEVEGVICSGAMKGKAYSYALLDERVPFVRPVYRDEALAMLARIYFNSHSPATLQDFIWWSGQSVADARQGLESVKQELVGDIINGQEYWIAGTGSDTQEPGLSAHLLPAFDEYIIAYRDRQAVLGDVPKSRVISSNGMFSPVILVNGVAVGVWRRPARKQTNINFYYFTPPDADTELLIRQATDNYLRFTEHAAPFA